MLLKYFIKMVVIHTSRQEHMPIIEWYTCSRKPGPWIHSLNTFWFLRFFKVILRKRTYSLYIPYPAFLIKAGISKTSMLSSISSGLVKVIFFLSIATNISNRSSTLYGRELLIKMSKPSFKVKTTTAADWYFINHDTFVLGIQ